MLVPHSFVATLKSQYACSQNPIDPLLRLLASIRSTDGVVSVLTGPPFLLRMSKILKKQDFGAHGFRWLTLKRITYEDPRGR